jgi:phosphoglycerate dehydrogenase-like enzyme
MNEKTLTLLVENESGLGPVFEVDPARYREAAARHPDVASRVRAVFSTDRDRFAQTIGEADALVGWVFPHRELDRLAPQLRWVHLTGAGVNHLAPFDWGPPGLVVTNNRGVHAPKAAEFAAAAALMIVNKLPRLVSRQWDRHWELDYSETIGGKTAGIVGVGNMGAAVAGACRTIGMRVLGMRRSGAPRPEVDHMFGPEELDVLLAQSDVVFLCTPLTDETRSLMDAARFARMKPGSGIVNLARGAVVDNDALRAALASGQVSGAILDVFDPEPLPADSPLWTTPNLIVTPHCSSDDAQSYVPRTLDLIFDNLRRLMTGQTLRGIVDPRLGY